MFKVIRNSVPIFLMPVKIFRQFNLAENIIDSGNIPRNNLYWRKSRAGKVETILNFIHTKIDGF